MQLFTRDNPLRPHQQRMFAAQDKIHGNPGKNDCENADGYFNLVHVRISYVNPGLKAWDFCGWRGLRTHANPFLKYPALKGRVSAGGRMNRIKINLSNFHDHRRKIIHGI